MTTTKILKELEEIEDIDVTQESEQVLEEYIERLHELFEAAEIENSKHPNDTEFSHISEKIDDLIIIIQAEIDTREYEDYYDDY